MPVSQLPCDGRGSAVQVYSGVCRAVILRHSGQAMAGEAVNRPMRKSMNSNGLSFAWKGEGNVFCSPVRKLYYPFVSD